MPQPSNVPRSCLYGMPNALACWMASTSASPTPSQAGSTSRFCVHAKIQGMARRLSTPPEAWRSQRPFSSLQGYKTVKDAKCCAAAGAMTRWSDVSRVPRGQHEAGSLRISSHLAAGGAGADVQVAQLALRRGGAEVIHEQRVLEHDLGTSHAGWAASARAQGQQTPKQCSYFRQPRSKYAALRARLWLRRLGLRFYRSTSSQSRMLSD